jgi:hypothetical protein
VQTAAHRAMAMGDASQRGIDRVTASAAITLARKERHGSLHCRGQLEGAMSLTDWIASRSTRRPLQSSGATTQDISAMNLPKGVGSFSPPAEHSPVGSFSSWRPRSPKVKIHLWRIAMPTCSSRFAIFSELFLHGRMAIANRAHVTRKGSSPGFAAS